jgi:hypothetical protein
MAIEIKTGEPNLFYEPYVDMQNRLRTKIACIIGVDVSSDDGGTRYFAYGSAVRSLDDDYNQVTGENIAVQRAERVVEEVKWYKGTIQQVRDWLSGVTIPKEHIDLLSSGSLASLESRLLPFKGGTPALELVRQKPVPRSPIEDTESRYGVDLGPVNED